MDEKLYLLQKLKLKNKGRNPYTIKYKGFFLYFF